MLRRACIPVAAALLVVGAIVPASAQDNSLQFKLGGFFPAGGGEFWSESEDVFRFAVDDLDDWVVGLTYTRSVGRYVDLGLNLDFYDAWSSRSYRDWVDTDGFAIVHDARLSTVPLSVDLRLVPTGRTASRGRVPSPRTAFYLGAGIGANFWTYEEVGDFIDFGDPDLPVFYGRFADSGTAFEVHALAGLEIPLGARWRFLAEGKYVWSEATLGPSIPVDANRIDLGGLAVSAGMAVRF